MWAVAAQHKKYHDALADYNSLKDPHLSSYFRKPRVRRHLIKANIINKDNKIVEEISSTKHLQDTERKHKRQFYELLEEFVKQNELLQSNSQSVLPVPTTSLPPAQSETRSLTHEELIEQAKRIFKSEKKDNHHLNDTRLGPPINQERSSLLLRLERMIRVVTDHDHAKVATVRRDHHLDTGRPLHFQPPYISTESKMRPSKSCQDIADKLNKQLALDQQIKLHSCTSHLSRELRPKSSYGRQRVTQLTGSHLDLQTGSVVAADLRVASGHTTTTMNTMRKAKSCNDNIAALGDDKEVGLVNDADIESVEGDSWCDSDHESDPGHSESRFIHDKSFENEIWRKKLFNVVEKNWTRQQVKMTLKYNGLNGATNRAVKRHLKVFQQVSIGGNSIMIFDGYVMPGETFSFNIRPHPHNSFAITILVNGIRDLRLNACCEHKHRPGTRLSHFIFVDVVGGKPCFLCQQSTFDNKRWDVNTGNTKTEWLEEEQQQQNFTNGDDQQQLGDVPTIHLPCEASSQSDKLNDSSTLLPNGQYESINTESPSEVLQLKEMIENNDLSTTTTTTDDPPGDFWKEKDNSNSTALDEFILVNDVSFDQEVNYLNEETLPQIEELDLESEHSSEDDNANA